MQKYVNKRKQTVEFINNQYIKNFCVEDPNTQKIIHYIGKEKPWTFSGRKNDFIKIYFDYWNKSGLRRYKVYYGLIALYSDYKDIFQKLRHYLYL